MVKALNRKPYLTLHKYITKHYEKALFTSKECNKIHFKNNTKGCKLEQDNIQK